MDIQQGTAEKMGGRTQRVSYLFVSGYRELDSITTFNSMQPCSEWDECMQDRKDGEKSRKTK